MKEPLKIEDLVFKEVQIRCPGMQISDNQRLIEDLRLLSDDAEEIAIVLQRKLGIRVPNSRWSAVQTVQDVINLLREYQFRDRT
jgi:acyl carrier protein